MKISYCSQRLLKRALQQQFSFGQLNSSPELTDYVYWGSTAYYIFHICNSFAVPVLSIPTFRWVVSHIEYMKQKHCMSSRIRLSNISERDSWFSSITIKTSKNTNAELRAGLENVRCRLFPSRIQMPKRQKRLTKRIEILYMISG